MNPMRSRCGLSAETQGAEPHFSDAPTRVLLPLRRHSADGRFGEVYLRITMTPFLTLKTFQQAAG